MSALGSGSGLPRMRCYLKELIARVRSELVADKHPRTAAALQELALAVKAEIKVKFKQRLQPRRGMRNNMYYLGC